MLKAVLQVLAVLALAQGLDAKPAVLPTVAQYQGQQVAQVLGVDSQAKAELLGQNVHEILLQRYGKGGMTARVSPEQVVTLKELGFDVKIVVEDLAVYMTQAMANEMPVLESRHVEEADGHFTRYYNYMQIGAYLDELAVTQVVDGVRPNWLKMRGIGKTEESRPIWAVELGNPKAPNAIYIEAGLHAREWVSMTSVQYIIAQMVDKFAHGEDPALFDTYKFFFVPLVNTDGFRYSYLGDRLWRKNRGINFNVSCPGTDLNRNYNGFNGWKLEPDECKLAFGGPEPYSASETRTIVRYLDNIKAKHRVVAAFDIHSYDQSILYPYGYDYNLPDAPNKKELVECATAMSEAMKAATGKVYKVINSAEFYPGYGCMDDYLYDQVTRGPFANDTGIVYTIEQRPTEDDPIGFVLPADQILPAAQELYAGFLAAIKYLDGHIRPTK